MNASILSVMAPSWVDLASLQAQCSWPQVTYTLLTPLLMVRERSTAKLQAKFELARPCMHSLACEPRGGPPAPAAQTIIMVATVRFPYAH